MPAARAVWPKISDTYWADSSGRCNASKVRSCDAEVEAASV
jgi:hypothetical protein